MPERRRRELEAEAVRARRVAEAYRGTPLEPSYLLKAEIAEMRVALARSEQNCPRAASTAGGVART